jgi:hypothetical protein
MFRRMSKESIFLREPIPEANSKGRAAAGHMKLGRSGNLGHRLGELGLVQPRVRAAGRQ